MTEPTLTQIKQATDNNTRMLTDMLNRTARIETRLTQLMLFEGMQSDGRKALTPRGQTYVG